MFFDLKTDQRTHVFAWFDGQEIRCGENPEIALGDYGGDAACVETPTGALFAVACTRAGLVGVLFAMQASVDPAEAIVLWATNRRPVGARFCSV